MFRRPQPGDTEEDLLKQQEDFLAQRTSQPAAKLVRRPDKRKTAAKGDSDKSGVKVKKDVVEFSGTPLSTPQCESAVPAQKKQSRFKMHRQPKASGSSQKVTFDLDDDDELDPEEAMDRRDTHITTVLTKIIERDANPTIRFTARTTNQGFPSVLHRGSTLHQKPSQDAKRKKKSLFAQQFDSTSPANFGVHIAVAESTGLGGDSCQDVREDVVPPTKTGSNNIGEELSRIHEDNLAQLSEMSELEILEEQQRIRTALDPSLLSFIQSRQHQTERHNLNPDPQPSGSCRVQSSSPDRVEPMETDRPVSEGDTTTNARSAELSESDDISDPANVNVKADWLHMNQAEREKLEWLKDLPKPSTTTKGGSAQARFDFNGRLVARDAAVPVREGLHHHGEEQEVPGYTLEELFTLSRSAVTQQRVLALQTLARVTYNNRLNQLGGELRHPLLSHLLDAGLLFLLRWSLDDGNSGVVAASLEGLAALLVQPGDEDVLDRVFAWHCGSEVPPMSPLSTSADGTEETDEGEEIHDREKSDHQIAKRDVIKGLLRMKLLPRLRYILEVVQPPAPVVLNSLAILIRVCRHSQQACHEVAKCPRLLGVIVARFLPTSSWKHHHHDSIVTDVYDYPVVLAMKLMLVLCLSGRNLAASILSGYNLMSVITRYISIEPADMPLNIAEAYHLSTTSLRTWRVCVGYGLACQHYRELYPLLMQQLTLFQRLSVHPLSSKDKEGDAAVHRLQLSRAGALIGLLEGVVAVAGTAAGLRTQLRMNNDSTATTPAATLPSPPNINWSQVSGLMAPLGLCARRWLHEMTTTSFTLEPEATDMVASLLNLLASFYASYARQVCYQPIECLSGIEQLVDVSLVPFMMSSTFHSVLVNLKLQSALRSSPSPSREPMPPPSLPDLGCHPQDQDRNYPPVRRESTLGLAVGMLRMVHTLTTVHRGVAGKFSPIVESAYVTAYLKRVIKNSRTLSSELRCYLARFEHQALYYLLKVYQSVVQQVSSSQPFSNLYHGAALALLACLQPGEEYYVHDLMSCILFDRTFLVEGQIGDPIAVDLAERLTVAASQTTSAGRAPSLVTIGPSSGELLQMAYDSLVGIRNLYMVFYGPGVDALARSRAKVLLEPHAIETHTLPEFTGSILPVDWTFLPLLHLHKEAQTAEMRGKTVHSLPPHILTMLVDTLKWIHLLEAWRPQCLGMVPQSAKIARLYCIFLTGSNLFLEEPVRHYLVSLLRMYTRPDHLSRLDFDAAIPGVASFYDLYMQLLTQYEAVSFGDPLFAHFVLLPLQQTFGVGLRKALWCEHADALRALCLPVDQLILPLENFLQPQEANLDLLNMYTNSLVRGVVKQPWAPVMYLVAVHHVTGFLLSGTGSNSIEVVRARLRQLRLLASIKDQVVFHHITHYQGPDVSQPTGFSLYPAIPADRAAILEAAQRR